MKQKAQKTKSIKLTQGYSALVDAEDYEFLSQFNWCIQQYKNKNRNAKIYAKRAYKGSHITMHRFLLNAPKGVSVDHINGNSLDNRRSNLRLCTKQDNAANRPKDRLKAPTSKYKGVYKPSKSKKFVCRIHVNGFGIHLGVFDNEEAAALAYNKAALEYFGEYAWLNQLP